MNWAIVVSESELADPLLNVIYILSSHVARWAQLSLLCFKQFIWPLMDEINTHLIRESAADSRLIGYHY